MALVGLGELESSDSVAAAEDFQPRASWAS